MLRLERPSGRDDKIGSIHQITRLSPANWIDRNVKIGGKAMNLRWRPWWVLPYNLEHHRFPDGTYRRASMEKAGRQVEKSSSLAAKLLAQVQVPWTSALYVAPSAAQLSEFSFRRIDEVVLTSPTLAETRDLDAWSVSRKSFLNHSNITLRSAFRSADRVRGIPADVLVLDEAQDLLLENIPIIRETQAHCTRPEGPIYQMLGTPKSYDNPLEYFWSMESTQGEWVIRCSGCGNRTLEGVGENNVGPRGLICEKCGKHLNPFEGTWMRTGRDDAPVEGFRIPQLLMPYSYAYDPRIFGRMWAEIINKMRFYPRPQFYNEVLGLSYDSGDKPVTREDIRECCGNEHTFLDVEAFDFKIDPRIGNGLVFCGVDWGTGGASKTVFSACHYQGDVFRNFYMKKFEGPEADPEYIVPAILNLLERVRADMVGVDWGFGFGLNSRIRAGFGADKTYEFSHSQMQREKVKYDSSANVFVTNRTAVMSDLFRIIKMRGFQFSLTWQMLRDSGFSQDFLCNHKEATRMGKMIYNHPPGTADDALHSVLYAFLVSQSRYPRADLQ